MKFLRCEAPIVHMSNPIRCSPFPPVSSPAGVHLLRAPANVTPDVIVSIPDAEINSGCRVARVG